MLIIYDFILLLTSLILFPILGWKNLRSKKYSGTFLSRLGFGYPRNKTEKKSIWLHGNSVGEVKALKPLFEHFIKRSAPIYISTITKTGLSEAKRLMSDASGHFILPLDFSWNMKRLVRSLNPDILLISETDLWPQMLHHAKRHGAKIMLVNGKMSERSHRRCFQWKKIVRRYLLGPIDLFCVQSDAYKDRFLQLEVPEKEIIPTGNIKLNATFAPMSPEEKKQFQDRLGISREDRVIAIASTHDPEESILVDQMKKLMMIHPEVKILLVPRHPERGKTLYQQMQTKFPISLYSELDKPTRFIIMDEMGIMAKCYQLSNLALVGGSFVPGIGGHNIIEPLQYHVPVVFGPFMENQPTLLHLIQNYRAGMQVDQSQVFETLLELIEKVEKRQNLIEAGEKLLQETRGAVDKTIQALERLVNNKSV